MKRIRYLRKKNEAVSAVIGTILIISIVMSSISFVMIFYIPQMERMKAFSQYEAVNTQFGVLENSLSNLISNGDGSTEKNNVGIESGSFSMNNIDEDRLVVMYACDGYDFNVTGLNDGDKNFILDMIDGQVSQIKVRSSETTSNYSKFVPSAVPPPSADSPYEVKIYDFNDPDNKAYNTDQGTSNPLDPHTDIDSFSIYQADEYNNITSDDSNRNLWEGYTTPPPYNKYANLLYFFKVDESPSSINRINFSWTGYDTLTNDGYFGLYIYNNDSSSWQELSKTSNSFTEETLSFNLTSNDLGEDDFSSFINDSGYMIFAASGAKGPGEPTNNPPNEPSNPSPSDGAVDQRIDVGLSWDGGDPDGDDVTYDIYFGTREPLPLLESGHPENRYRFERDLSYGTLYYWQIVAEDSYGETTSGSVWRFITSNAPNRPPNEPSNPSPSDGAVDQRIDVGLSWDGGDPDGDDVTYDIYFGTREPLPLLESGHPENRYRFERDLSYGTLYYWQIVAEDSYGETTSGSVWCFSTIRELVESIDFCMTLDCCCFPAGTKITMANGSYKNIEDVKVGDFVKSYNEVACLFENREVLELESPVREGYYELFSSDKKIVEVTNEHPFYVKKSDGSISWCSIEPSVTHKYYPNLYKVQKLEIDDKIFNENGNWVELTDWNYVKGPIQTFNLKNIGETHTFFAEGLLVHNKEIPTSHCLGPLDDSNVWSDDNDLYNFHENSISFSDGFFGFIPSYRRNCLDSPLYTYKTLFSTNKDTNQPTIFYLGYSDYISNSHFTLYENYLDLKVFYNSGDGISPSSSITIKPDKLCTEKSISFSWKGYDDTTDSEDLVYKYRLDPYQTSWQPGQDSWTSSTSVTYNDLAYGDYIFRVRARDEAMNIETFENIGINTYSFSIVESTQILNGSTNPDDFPIDSDSGPVSLDVYNDISDFSHIELYNGDDVVGGVYVFDFVPLSWELSSSSGIYSVYMENDAIFSSSGNNIYVMTKKPDGIYTNDGSFIFHVVQTVVSSDSAISSSGSGSLSLVSRLVENRVLEDSDIGMLKVQNFGKFSDVWNDYYSEVHSFSSSDDVTLVCSDTENLVLVYSIIELDMESG